MKIIDFLRLSRACECDSRATILTPVAERRTVRPVLRRILAFEILVAFVLLVLDTPHAWLLRRKLSGITFTLGHFQAVVTTLAIVAVVAVALEAARVVRLRRANRAGKECEALLLGHAQSLR
jgi:hypothetical protein